MSFIKKLKKCNIVSFDIFDTLLQRNISHHNILLIINDELHKIYNIDFSYIDVWHSSFVRASNLKNNCSFNEIFDNMDIDSKLKEYAKKRELELEKISLKKIEKNYNLYVIAKKMNKKIILTSDMYLDSIFLSDVLNDNNINDFFKIYVSNEFGCSKKSGELFNIIKKENPNQRILHIGDSFISDYIQPKLHGILSYRINKINQSSNNINEDISLKIQNNIVENKNIFFEIGYKIFGPLVYQFIFELDKISKDYERTLFLSRDAYIIKKAYDIIHTENNFPYVYVSRRSLSVPNLEKYDCKNDFLNNITIRNNETIETIFKKMGLDLTLYENRKLLEYELPKNSIYTDKKFNEIFEKYYSQLRDNIKKEHINLNNYINGNMILGKKVLLVDIGWRGTIQNLLSQLYPEVDFSGFYMTCYDDFFKDDKHFSFLMKEKNDYEKNIIFCFNGIIETVFSAPHGSCKCYDEYGSPILDEDDQEKKNFEYVNMMHNGILEYVKKYNEYHLYLTDDFNFIESNLFKFLLRPKRKHITAFKRFSFYDISINNLINSRGFIYYLFHFKQLKKDLSKSNWKSAFMKDVFKLDLNYSKILIKYFNK